MNITIPFRHAESTSSTSGWSKPDSSTAQPRSAIVQTMHGVELGLAPALVVAQVQRLEHVGDQARDVVDDAEGDEHQRDRAEDPEERSEPRRDDVLEDLALALDEGEVGLVGQVLAVAPWRRPGPRR